jgi:hypothetical protein
MNSAAKGFSADQFIKQDDGFTARNFPRFWLRNQFSKRKSK